MIHMSLKSEQSEKIKNNQPVYIISGQEVKKVMSHIFFFFFVSKLFFLFLFLSKRMAAQKQKTSKYSKHDSFFVHDYKIHLKPIKRAWKLLKKF